MVITRVCGSRGNGMLVKRYKLPGIRWIMYNMVTIVNNNVYFKFAKRLDLKFSHYTHIEK